MDTPNSICPLVLAAVAMAWTPICSAEFRVVKTGDSVVDAEALTIKGAFGQSINGLSFQQSVLVTHRGYQYVAYYDADRWVCIARRALPEDDWEILRLTDYRFKSNDAHNVVSMGICPADGTIHLAFDHHGHPLHYRVSQKEVASAPRETSWNASLFGAVHSELERGKPISITYPRFWQTPDGALQFCYRRGGSGNGDRMLVDYDPKQGLWVHTRPIDSGKGVWKSSDSRCSYPNGYDYGPFGKLHATWVWREGPGTPNHDLVYVYSEDGGVSWKNNRGETLTEPPRVDSPGITAVAIGEQLGLMNTHGQAVDSKGRIHVIVWHCTQESLDAVGSAPGEQRWGPPEARRYHHYWRNVQGEWQHRELPGEVGNRPKIAVDKDDNAFVVYGAAHRRPCALHIAAATAASEWTDWKVVHVEEGPFLNEMVPDTARWKDEGILSLMVQEAPGEPHEPTTLRVLDFSVAADKGRARGVPTPAQIAWHEMEIEMFLCLDPCTWQGREYDDHSTPLGDINPAQLDTGQWCEVAQSFGAKQILFVAKHTGGFCWWQTDTSDYSIKNTPYKNGKGDVLAELAQSCRNHGLKLGVYIYPGDDQWGAGIGSGGRTSDPDKQEAYAEVLRRQWKEALTRYGAVSELWFDGSCVIDVGDVLEAHASDAMVFQGPHATLRWPGNEKGIAPYPTWQTVSREDAATGVSTGRHSDPDGDTWLPMEMDTTLLDHKWFWAPGTDHMIKSLDTLMDIYYKSVGQGCVLLLNATPDTTGRIPETHVQRYREFGNAIRRIYENKQGEVSGTGRDVELSFGQPALVNHIVTMEDIRHGHIVRAYEVDGLVDGEWRKLVDGTSIGYKRIDVIATVRVEGLRLRVTKAVGEPVIRSFAAYEVSEGR